MKKLLLILTKNITVKKIMILIVYLFLSESAFACTCINPPTYCETMQSETSDLLIVGYKITDIYHGMSIKIVQVLEGTETRDTITVWGDNGMLCRHSSASFSLYDTIVFALHNCDLYGNWAGGSYEQTDHYQISNCGVYYLDYFNGQVIGSIANGINLLNLNNFQQLHFSCSLTAIEEYSTNNQLLRTIDVLGRKAQGKKNEPLFYIYDDGTVEKRITIE
jgi:hypothetical protein